MNPVDYLADVLIRVQTHPAFRIDELLSQNWNRRQQPFLRLTGLAEAIPTR